MCDSRNIWRFINVVIYTLGLPCKIRVSTRIISVKVLSLFWKCLICSSEEKRQIKQ